MLKKFRQSGFLSYVYFGVGLRKSEVPNSFQICLDIAAKIREIRLCLPLPVLYQVNILRARSSLNDLTQRKVSRWLATLKQ